MDATTGKLISGRQYMAQSVSIALTTPIGSRCMRRTFGSLLFEMVDQAANQLLRVRFYGTIALALMRWVPDLKLSRIGLSAGEGAGAFLLDIEGEDTSAPPNNRAFRETIPLRADLAGATTSLSPT